MKTVYLLRHGKAENRDATDSDFERKLLKKGISRTESVANIMKSRGMIPSVIISSPAPRALETAHVFARIAGIPDDAIETVQSIYDQEEAEMFRLITGMDDSLDSMMLVGHDPSFTRLARNLTPEFRTSIPKSSVVGIDFDVSRWRDVRFGDGRLAAFEQPEA